MGGILIVVIALIVLAVIIWSFSSDSPNKIIRDGRLYANKTFECRGRIIKEGTRGAKIEKGVIFNCEDNSWADYDSIITNNSEVGENAYIENCKISFFRVYDCEISNATCHGMNEILKGYISKAKFPPGNYSWDMEAIGEHTCDNPPKQIDKDHPESMNMYQCIVKWLYLEKMMSIRLACGIGLKDEEWNYNSILDEILRTCIEKREVDTLFVKNEYLSLQRGFSHMMTEDRYDEMVHFSFIIRESYYNEIVRLAKEKQKVTNEILNEILEKYFDSWEKKFVPIFEPKEIKQERKVLDL